jgi:hypothetical protein
MSTELFIKADVVINAEDIPHFIHSTLRGNQHRYFEPENEHYYVQAHQQIEDVGLQNTIQNHLNTKYKDNSTAQCKAGLFFHTLDNQHTRTCHVM